VLVDEICLSVNNKMKKINTEYLKSGCGLLSSAKGLFWLLCALDWVIILTLWTYNELEMTAVREEAQ